MIAGFVRPDEGRVRLAGEDVTDTPPNERDVNTVFEDYARFRICPSNRMSAMAGSRGCPPPNAASECTRHSRWCAWKASSPAGRRVARLSFDEIAVTFFLAGADTTTLPLWILGAFRNSRSVPEANAAATVILLASLPMIALAAYLMRDEGGAVPIRQEQ